MADSPRREVPVEVESPDLSPETNRALTENVREALGTDRVELSPEAADRARHPHPSKAPPRIAGLWNDRQMAVRVLAVAVVIAAIMLLLTTEWWSVAVAVAVLLAATLCVVIALAHQLTEVEKPDPGVSEALEAEGVRDPEDFFNQTVRDFAGGDGGSVTSETLLPGDNERTARPADDPGRSTSEQATAMTPSSEAVDVAPADGAGRAAAEAPPLIPVLIAIGLLLAEVLIPLLAGGGALWLVLPIAGIPTVVLLVYQLGYLSKRR